MASLFSDFGFMWYWKELNKVEFMKFKELLILEILQMGLKQISWTEVKNASREDLAILLVKYCEGKQAWDTTFKVLQKISRHDLTERATGEIAAHANIYRAHLKKKLTRDCSRKFSISIQNFFQDEYDHLENLLIPKVTEEKPQLVFLKGIAGIGKTILLKNLMIVWSEGLVFQNKFSYIFYFCCQDVKQLKTTSLTELISREWPSSSAPIEEILSQPEKLLFIIDSLEGMEWDFTKQESELCDNCLEKQPVNVLLSSLLKKKILPESSLLISATFETFEELKDWIEYTNVRTITGFKESNIKMYFHSLFQDRNRALEAFSFVRENEQLFTLCQAPVICCMVATCLKNEIEKGKDPVSICRRTTSLYTTHIFNLFIPPNVQYPSKKSQDQLQGLCFLAVEGMWTDISVFSEETLRRNGILDSDIPTLLDIGILEQSRESQNSYIFFHPSVQEFCAAMFYLLQTHMNHPSPDVLHVEKLLFSFLKEVNTQWIFLGRFIFGLLNELEHEKLEAFFGYQLSQQLKQELFEWLELLLDPEVKVNTMKFFYCLFEMEEEVFVQSAMNCREEIDVVAKDYYDFIVAAYCLNHGSALRDLSISTQNVLNEKLNQRYMENLLMLWHNICSVFARNKDIHILQMKDTIFNEPVFQILYNYLKNSSCILEVLVANDVSFLCDKYLFFDLIQSYNLELLDLSGTFLSHSDVVILCNILNKAEYKIQELELANCSLSEQSWKYISDVLCQNKTLRHLDISSNDLKDEGLKVLCKALTLPDSVLLTLSVKACFITTVGCQYLAEVLRNNHKLMFLTLSENKLEDSGVKLLCDAIKHPRCQLAQLDLEACELTGACCEDLASTFTQCKTLGWINLVKNALDFNGLVVLCKALKQKTSNLKELRLRITDFDNKSQTFLLSEEKGNKFLNIENDE
ncbi:NACHT, LRR and PYD domains-containing protein 4B [Rattus norvegicus]|uniref:NLR family, pyrin domain containing 4B n=1 Tax=Rattus norvegicus TaxID=10116 RepID=D4A1P8_RAT|eukprot:XP_003748802.1 PREDICTED: NACHT, LRR and PYD domains-containing protein 4B-like [Rattus norvegicus]